MNNFESHDIVREIQKVDQYISLEEVIKMQSDPEHLKERFVYKLKLEGNAPFANPGGPASDRSSILREGVSSILKNKLIAIKVKKLSYKGKPSSAVYLLDQTRQIKQKID